jgi:hypothetical protein
LGFFSYKKKWIGLFGYKLSLSISLGHT